MSRRVKRQCGSGIAVAGRVLGVKSDSLRSRWPTLECADEPQQMDITWIEFPMRGDFRGRLIPMEAERAVPFAIRRVYALVDMDSGVKRGGHAHRTLRQVIIALRGSCVVRLADGKTETRVVLEQPDRGLLLEPMAWHDMSDFSEDCVLLVLAAEHYDESDYIRDWQEFVALGEGGGSS